ncbi:MAG: hypothetical protein NTU44_13940 [Bacteroidetes bacterium]|nr:hypothetical protein [Bacteroidota bacterium]
MRNYLNFLVICFVLISCKQVDPNKYIDEGYLKDNLYKSNEIGWTIQIPDGWEVVKPDNRVGKAAIEITTGAKIDLSEQKHLINFKKDHANLFVSTSQPFKEEYPGEFIEGTESMNKIIYDTYKSRGAKTDTSSGSVFIDGMEFRTFTIKIYSEEGGLILNQILYSGLVNGYDLGININYNNEKDKNIMLEALMKSKFDKK